MSVHSQKTRPCKFPSGQFTQIAPVKPWNDKYISSFNPSETIVSYKLLHAQTYRRNFVLRDSFNQDASMFTISATVRINVL